MLYSQSILITFALAIPTRHLAAASDPRIHCSTGIATVLVISCALQCANASFERLDPISEEREIDAATTLSDNERTVMQFHVGAFKLRNQLSNINCLAMS
jgi:hypothetical protein